MRSDAKVKKMRIAIIVQVEEEGNAQAGFQELIRIEKEMDTLPVEAGKMQAGLEPLLQQMASGGPGFIRRRVTKVKLDPPAATPKQLPPGPQKAPPKKGGNGKDGAN